MLSKHVKFARSVDSSYTIMASSSPLAELNRTSLAPWKGGHLGILLTELLNVTVSGSAFPWTNGTAGPAGAGGNGTYVWLDRVEGVVATTEESGGVVARGVTSNSIFIKIGLLLILTAVVLLTTYKFVIRLFSGYSDRKDDSSDYYIGIQEES